MSSTGSPIPGHCQSMSSSPCRWRMTLPGPQSVCTSDGRANTSSVMVDGRAAARRDRSRGADVSATIASACASRGECRARQQPHAGRRSRVMDAMQQLGDIGDAASPRTAGHVAIHDHRRLVADAGSIRHQLRSTSRAGEMGERRCLVVGQVRVHRVGTARVLHISLLDDGARRGTHTPHLVAIPTGEQCA